MPERLRDKYASLTELELYEREGRDFRVHAVHRPASPILVIAPHGGMIELGTSDVARHIALERHSLFLFEGLRAHGSRDLHVTSHRFEHPRCAELLRGAEVVLGVHGCRGTDAIFFGGLDDALIGHLAAALVEAGLPSATSGHDYPGRHPDNVCNRGRSGRGVQVELTLEWRRPPRSFLFAAVLRDALSTYTGIGRSPTALKATLR